MGRRPKDVTVGDALNEALGALNDLVRELRRQVRSGQTLTPEQMTFLMQATDRLTTRLRAEKEAA